MSFLVAISVSGTVPDCSAAAVGGGDALIVLSTASVALEGIRGETPNIALNF
jgi:hypothetical protein